MNITEGCLEAERDLEPGEDILDLQGGEAAVCDNTLLWAWLL